MHSRATARLIMAGRDDQTCRETRRVENHSEGRKVPGAAGRSGEMVLRAGEQSTREAARGHKGGDAKAI